MYEAITMITVAEADSGIKIWNGSVYKDQVRVWDGTEWRSDFKVWNGSEYI